MQRWESAELPTTPSMRTWGPKPDHVRRLVVLPDGVQRFVPSREYRAGVRVEVAADRGVPHRITARVEGGCIVGRPPHLVVSRGGDMAHHRPGAGAPDRGV